MENVIDVLIEDHRLMGELLERLDGEDRPAEMRTLFVRIASELAAHEAAEDDVVYPAVRAAIPTDADEVLGLIAEHDEVNSLLTEMLGLDPAGFGLVKRAAALVVELQAHFAEEEERLFPHIRSVLGREDLAGLAAQVRMARRFAPIFPEPHCASAHHTGATRRARRRAGSRPPVGALVAGVSSCAPSLSPTVLVFSAPVAAAAGTARVVTSSRSTATPAPAATTGICASSSEVRPGVR